MIITKHYPYPTRAVFSLVSKVNLQYFLICKKVNLRQFLNKSDYIQCNRPFAGSSHMVRNYAGTQVTQWDFQNKGTRHSPTQLSFDLKVPLCTCNLRRA